VLKIVLDMQNELYAEAVKKALLESGLGFVVFTSEKPEETVSLCHTCRANVLLMEIGQSKTRNLSERLKMLDGLKSKSSGQNCKTIFLVDEKADDALAADVRQAVKDKLVDNFVYTSVSASYLAGVIDIL
jgi:hypothetical protein